MLGHDSTNPKKLKSYLSGLKFRLWKIGDPVPKAVEEARIAPGAPGIAEFASSPAPGAYWLSLEPKGCQPDGAGSRRAAKAVGAAHDRGPAHTDADLRVLAFARSGLLFERDALRRVELLERIMLDGRLDAGYELANELLARQVNNPVAGCLAGYVYLRLGRTEELKDTVKSLTNSLPRPE